METLNENLHSSNMKLASKINSSNETKTEKRFSSTFSRQSHYDKLRDKKRNRKHRRSFINEKSKSRAHRKHRSKKPKGYYDISTKSLSDSKFRSTGSFNSIFNKSHRNHKSKQLPILASIELIKEKCDEQLAASIDKKTNGTAAVEKVLFKDYVLIPSCTKFKHLLYTVLDHVRFPNKNDYNVLDGYLKIENWKPIRLDNISSITQCPLTQSSSSTFTSSTSSISNLKKETENYSANNNVKVDAEYLSEANAQIKTNNNNNNNNSDNSNNVNTSNNNTNNNENNVRTANDSVMHLSLPTSLNTSSSRISLSSSSNESSRNSSSSRRSSNYRTRRHSLSSSSTQNSDYSDYENSYDSEDENENTDSVKSSDTMTVNDMLYHVISFATLSIKLTVKTYQSELSTKTLQKSQSLSKIEDPTAPAVVQTQQQKVQLNPQQSFLQNYLMSLQSKQNTENSSQPKNPTLPISQLLQNSGLFNQNSSKSSDDIQKKFNEILLPMIMMSNQANVAASMSNSMPASPASSSSTNTPLSNFNNQPTNTTNNANASPLTSSQLATLLPILNLPILSQLLNGIKNNSGDAAGHQQQLKSLFHEPLNLSSTANNPLNRQIKSENTNGLNFEGSHVNQPLNLCKENSQAGRKLSNFNSSSKSPPPNSGLSMTDRNNFLLVNVNGNSNNPSNNAQNNSNSVITSIFNTSPSPSISSSSSSSAPSSEKSLNPSLQLIAPHPNQHKHFSNMSNTKNSYIVNNRRQRERTTFDPQEEITRLMQIFERTHHPTRYQIASICDSLNSLACRRDKKPLEPYNIQYWFKNARAALRRKVKGEPEVNNKNVSSGLGNSSLKTDFDKILNGNSANISHNSLNLSSTNNENYPDSKYSNYDDDENDLDDEEYDDDFDHDQENGYTIDESKLSQVNSDTDLNNNNMNSLNQNDEMKLLINENGKHDKNASDGEENGQLNEHSLPYENYNDENTGDDADDNHYVNSNYSNVNINNENDNECNESYDEDGFKHNANSTMNSASMSNLLAGQYKNKNLMGNNNAASLNNSICNNRRNRVFIDPISEVPILEHYFSIETYPDHYLIEKICENLNKGEYRFKFPKLESRNIQLWFKNHRAKLKRLKSTPSSNNNSSANITSSDDIGQNQSINSNGDEKAFNLPSSLNLAQGQSLNSSIDEKSSFNIPSLLNVPVNNQESF